MVTRAIPTLWVACTLALGAARAQHDPFARGFDLVPTKPTPALESGIALEGATPSQVRSQRFAALFDLNVGLLALQLGHEKIGDLVPFRWDAHLMAAYQVHRLIEVGADIQLTLLNVDNSKLLVDRGFPEQPYGTFGFGSARVVPRVFILDPASWPIGLAAIPEIRFPSPSANGLMGDRSFVFAPRLAAERTLGPLRILANMGYRLRAPGAQYLNIYVGNEFVMGAGAMLFLPDFKWLTTNRLIGEMHLVTPVERPFNFDQADALKTPWELLVGVRSSVRTNWEAELTFGRGLGLQGGYGRETFRTMIGIRYEHHVADRDHDGIEDDVDQCPDDPEDRDGFQDSDGCPDPDNDADSVPDVEDYCPSEPGSTVTDGCPDRDGDLIPDRDDLCPDEPGPVENEGCPIKEEPQVTLESDRIRIRGNIMFEVDSAVIQQVSYKQLDDVAKVLQENSELGPVLIEGHTDNRGSRAYNQDLSQKRAKAVVDYLVSKGVAKKRLRSAGFSFDKPVATNDTPLGRAKNRRTEFRLLSEGGPDQPSPAPSPEPTPAPTPKP